VLATTDVKKTLYWYREMLGLVRSEDIYEGEPDHLIGSFNRVDQGEEFVDHHAFFCRHANKVGLNHISFEVQDIDDVMSKHALEEMIARLRKKIKSALPADSEPAIKSVWGRGYQLCLKLEISN